MIENLKVDFCVGANFELLFPFLFYWFPAWYFPLKIINDQDTVNFRNGLDVSSLGAIQPPIGRKEKRRVEIVGGWVGGWSLVTCMCAKSGNHQVLERYCLEGFKVVQILAVRQWDGAKTARSIEGHTRLG